MQRMDELLVGPNSLRLRDDMDEDEMARGLDHLMEQNETDLPFLASYGADMDGMGIDVDALFLGVETFLSSRRVKFDSDEKCIKYNSTCITKHEEGCLSKLNTRICPLFTATWTVLASSKERCMETNRNFRSSFRCGAENTVASSSDWSNTAFSYAVRLPSPIQRLQGLERV